MKIKQSNTSVATGATDIVTQTINLSKLDYATKILRDSIYEYKLTAAIRETLMNAVDEHRMHNVTRPVDVFITETHLVVRDYALGLSHDGVTRVFAQYFESTKSDSNDSIGGFGIGAKAPLCYTSTYNIRSYYNGVCSLYTSYVDGMTSKMALMSKTDCGDSTGMAIEFEIDGCEVAEITGVLAAAVGLFKRIELGDSYVPEIRIQTLREETPMGYTDILEKANSYSWRNHTDAIINDISANNVLGEAAPDVLSKLRTGLLHIPGTATLIKLKSSSNHYYNRYLDISADLTDTGIFAYDGDIVYRVPTDTANTTRLSSTIIRLASTHCILLHFERGFLTLAPSRERIEPTHTAAQWYANTTTRLSELLNEGLTDHIKYLGEVYNKLQAGEVEAKQYPWIEQKDSCLATIAENMKFLCPVSKLRDILPDLYIRDVGSAGYNTSTSVIGCTSPIYFILMDETSNSRGYTLRGFRNEVAPQWSRSVEHKHLAHCYGHILVTVARSKLHTMLEYVDKINKVIPNALVLGRDYIYSSTIFEDLKLPKKEKCVFRIQRDCAYPKGCNTNYKPSKLFFVEEGTPLARLSRRIYNRTSEGKFLSFLRPAKCYGVIEVTSRRKKAAIAAGYKDLSRYISKFDSAIEFYKLTVVPYSNPLTNSMSGVVRTLSNARNPKGHADAPKTNVEFFGQGDPLFRAQSVEVIPNLAGVGARGNTLLRDALDTLTPTQVKQIIQHPYQSSTDCAESSIITKKISTLMKRAVTAKNKDARAYIDTSTYVEDTIVTATQAIEISIPKLVSDVWYLLTEDMRYL